MKFHLFPLFFFTLYLAKEVEKIDIYPAATQIHHLIVPSQTLKICADAYIQYKPNNFGMLKKQKDDRFQLLNPHLEAIDKNKELTEEIAKVVSVKQTLMKTTKKGPGFYQVFFCTFIKARERVSQELEGKEFAFVTGFKDTKHLSEIGQVAIKFATFKYSSEGE